MNDNFLNNNFEKATDNTSENNEKNNISKSSAIFSILAIFAALILLMLYRAIIYFFKYFESISKIPLELNDVGITNLINNNNTINFFTFSGYIIAIIPFFVLLFSLLKSNKKENKRKSLILILIFFILIMIIPYIIVAPTSFKTTQKTDNIDWNISIGKVTKKQRGGKNGRRCYVYLEGITERKEVASDEFKAYIWENDYVYIITDNKNNKTTILSTKHYKYVGDKLGFLPTFLTTTNNKIKRGHFLYFGILLTVVALLFFLCAKHLYNNYKKTIQTFD